MSISFFIVSDTEEPKTKVYMKDMYPDLDEEYFSSDPFLQKDENGYYEMRGTWPEANFSNVNGFTYISMLGLAEDMCGTICNENLPAVRREILQMLNQHGKMQGYTYPDQQEGNFHIFGMDEDRIINGLKSIDAVCAKAQELGADVGWG